VCPETIVLFFGDLFKKHPSLKYKDVFMTINWLKTYSIAHVMAANWGRCEECINPVLEEYIAKFASLKEGKIRMERFEDETIIVFSIDACHFMVERIFLRCRKTFSLLLSATIFFYCTNSILLIVVQIQI